MLPRLSNQTLRCSIQIYLYRSDSNILVHICEYVRHIVSTNIFTLVFQYRFLYEYYNAAITTCSWHIRCWKIKRNVDGMGTGIILITPLTIFMRQLVNLKIISLITWVIDEQFTFPRTAAVYIYMYIYEEQIYMDLSCDHFSLFSTPRGAHSVPFTTR